MYRVGALVFSINSNEKKREAEGKPLPKLFKALLKIKYSKLRPKQFQGQAIAARMGDSMPGGGTHSGTGAGARGMLRSLAAEA